MNRKGSYSAPISSNMQSTSRIAFAFVSRTASQKFFGQIRTRKCILCAIHANALITHTAVNALITADFRANRARPRNIVSGFESR